MKNRDGLFERYAVEEECYRFLQGRENNLDYLLRGHHCDVCCCWDTRREEEYLVSSGLPQQKSLSPAANRRSELIPTLSDFIIIISALCAIPNIPGKSRH